MFTSLPMPKGVDADDLLGGYLVALEGMPPATLKSVVIQLIKGIWREDVKFCPRPPELANMVRAEQRRIDAQNRPRLPGPAIVERAFNDIKITHRLRADELAKAGYVLIAEGVDHDGFSKLAKSRGIPAGSRHLFATSEIWAPQAVAHLADTRAIETRKAAAGKSVIEADPTPEQIERWKKIMAMPDANRELSADEMAHRRAIAAKIGKATDKGSEAA